MALNADFAKRFVRRDEVAARDAQHSESVSMATHDAIDHFKDWFRAEVNAALIKMWVGVGAMGAIALAIAKLT